MKPSEELQANAIDRMTSVAKSIVGAAPVIGSLMTEIVGSLIPNQRIDRLCRFVTILDQKVRALDNANKMETLRDEPVIDLLEDALLQASRAMTPERLEYIAELLANSLDDEQLDYAQSKTALSLLNQLSDPEIILLQFYAKQTSDDFEAFYDTHRAVIEGPSLGSTSIDGLEKEAVHNAYRAHLQQLDLIRPMYVKPKTGEIPDFDFKTGQIKARSNSVTMLGRLLLRLIGLDDGLRGR